MQHSPIRLIALDMDGTITQHKTPLEPMNRAALDALRKQYRLLMVGAGACMRIFNQMGEYPIDIVGNYGLQACDYDDDHKTLITLRDEHLPVNRVETERRITYLREKHGFTGFAGDNVEYHASGCITFPILGTRANLADKLAFDPDRSRRRAFYEEVVELFPDYHVFVGGSSSFDMAPKPYNKLWALEEYCRRKGFAHHEVLFIGDDYGVGGNDEAVYHSDFRFLTIDDYTTFPQLIAPLLNQK